MRRAGSRGGPGFRGDGRYPHPMDFEAERRYPSKGYHHHDGMIRDARRRGSSIELEYREQQQQRFGPPRDDMRGEMRGDMRGEARGMRGGPRGGRGMRGGGLRGGRPGPSYHRGGDGGPFGGRDFDKRDRPGFFHGQPPHERADPYEHFHGRAHDEIERERMERQRLRNDQRNRPHGEQMHR